MIPRCHNDWLRYRLRRVPAHHGQHRQRCCVNSRRTRVIFTPRHPRHEIPETQVGPFLGAGQTVSLTPSAPSAKFRRSMRTVTWKNSLRMIWLAVFLATTLAQRVGLAEESFLFTSFRGNFLLRPLQAAAVLRRGPVPRPAALGGLLKGDVISHRTPARHRAADSAEHRQGIASSRIDEWASPCLERQTLAIIHRLRVNSRQANKPDHDHGRKIEVYFRSPQHPRFHA